MHALLHTLQALMLTSSYMSTGMICGTSDSGWGVGEGPRVRCLRDIQAVPWAASGGLCYPTQRLQVCGRVQGGGLPVSSTRSISVLPWPCAGCLLFNDCCPACFLRNSLPPQGTVRVVNSMTVEPLFDLETLFRPKPVVVSDQVAGHVFVLVKLLYRGSTQHSLLFALQPQRPRHVFAWTPPPPPFVSLLSLHSTSGPCVHPASTRAHSTGPQRKGGPLCGRQARQQEPRG
jgi:hypothetical protein